jgi:hypothetical protein
MEFDAIYSVEMPSEFSSNLAIRYTPYLADATPAACCKKFLVWRK